MARELTLTQIEDIFQGLFVSILGWDITSPSKVNDVRISWPEEGMPAFLITDDVVFVQCLEVDEPYNRQREVEDTWTLTTPELFGRTIGYTRAWQVNVILYGPDSYQNSQELRDKIFYPEHQNTLQKSYLYLVPDVAAPKRVPEYFQGRWWKRVDMSFVLYESVVRSTTVPAIDSISVTIYEGDEGNKIAEINNE